MQWLFTGIETFGSSVALIQADGSSMSYAQLASHADELARPLGPTRSLVLVEGANAVDSIAFYIGALRAGHVVALSGGDASLRGITQAFAPSHTYTQRDGLWVLESRQGDRAPLHPDLAVLLSTSGSTGSPKLIRLSHDNLRSNAQSIAEYLQLAPGERAITSLPPYYSYGLSILHSHLLLGHTIVLSDASVTDEAFWQQVDREGVTSVAGVPHSYELLARSGFFTRQHPSLRYMSQAGGKLAPDRVQQFARWASGEGKRFYVMYGQTEASPRMAYLPPEDAETHAHSIGRAVPGGAFRLRPLDGGGLPDGAGELIYRGPNVMMGYALSPADLALPQGSDELPTGDIAVLGDDGYYRITGRMSRFAKLFGLRIGLDDIEQRLVGMGVEAVVAGDDEGLVIATTAQQDVSSIAERLSAIIGIPTRLIAVVAVAAFPRLPSGKVDYRGVQAMRPQSTKADALPLVGQIAEVLGRPSVGGQESFVSLGGDSLSYVQVSMLVDEHLGYLPDGWEQLPINTLQTMVPATGNRVTRLDTSIFVRALAILLVMFHHVAQIAIGGSADALLVVAGCNFGRFTAPSIYLGNLKTALATLLWKVVTPYFIMLTLIFIYVGKFFWPQYFLFGNMTHGFFIDGKQKLKIFWFMEAYISIFLACALALAVPAVRRMGRGNPWLVAVAACLIAEGARVLAMEYAAPYNKEPAGLIWLFTLGWLIHLANTHVRKLVAVALALANILITIVVTGLSGQTAIYTGTLGTAVLALLFVRQVPVGRVMAALFSAFASASLYIYIAQPIVLQPIYRFYPDGTSALATVPVVLLCLTVGIGIWQMVTVLESLIAHVRNRAGRAGMNAPAALVRKPNTMFALLKRNHA